MSSKTVWTIVVVAATAIAMILSTVHVRSHIRDLHDAVQDLGEAVDGQTQALQKWQHQLDETAKILEGEL